MGKTVQGRGNGMWEVHEAGESLRHFSELEQHLNGWDIVSKGNTGKVGRNQTGQSLTGCVIYFIVYPKCNGR